MKALKSGLTHAFALLFFALLSLSYFSPLLQGKVLYQPDVANYLGGAKETNDSYQKTGKVPLWTGSMFGGMPTYFITTSHRNPVLAYLDGKLCFLPYPAHYLFILLLGFYLLLLSLRIEPKLASLGAMAFAFSTYFIIIIAAGHNSKVHAIAYIPPTIAGILLLFRKKYLLGFTLTALFLSLNVYTNHFQMTYYMSLLIGLYLVVQFIRFSRARQWGTFLKISALLVGAGLIALATNATLILTARQYTPYSTRGKSELTQEGANQTSGLDRDYITQWSYGKLETLNLLIPNLTGGSSSEGPESKPELRKVLRSYHVPLEQADYALRAIPTYWGSQPFTAGPAYQGAIVLFLFVLGLFLVKGKTKWWLALGSALSILLAWGKNFPPLTDFFIDCFPLYNKFRSVSSILVLFEFTAPLLGLLALREFFSDKTPQEEKQRSLKYAAAFVLGGIASLGLLGSSLLPFTNKAVDGRIPPFLRTAIRADRISLFQADAARSLALVVLTALVLYLFLKKKLNYNFSLLLLGTLVLIDLWPIDKRYLNRDHFVSEKVAATPFPKTDIERQILRDTSDFRVLNLSVNTMSDASTSYYFKSLGGYHGAKLKKYQELYDFQISKGNPQVINMLNAKYFITANPKGGRQVVKNTRANGNAWFVKGITYVKNADAEMAALDTLHTQDYAVAQAVFNSAKINAFKPENLSTSPGDTIFLKHYAPEELRYAYRAETPQLAILSEIYYPAGWKATIDGIAVPYFAVNYVLRALWVPAGQHEIVFRFDPAVVKTGTRIAAAGSTLLLAALGFCLWGLHRNRQSGIT